jgi:hypothetical protein
MCICRASRHSVDLWAITILWTNGGLRWHWLCTSSPILVRKQVGAHSKKGLFKIASQGSSRSRANLKAFRKGCCELHTPVVDYIHDLTTRQGA